MPSYRAKLWQTGEKRAAHAETWRLTNALQEGACIEKSTTPPPPSL